MTREHEAWRGLLANLATALRDGHAELAIGALDAFARRFRQWVRNEQEQLLPALEQLIGVAALSRAATARSEHRVLLDLLASVESAVGRGDTLVAEIDLRELCVTLELHMRKELHIADLLAEQHVTLSV